MTGCASGEANRSFTSTGQLTSAYAEPSRSIDPIKPSTDFKVIPLNNEAVGAACAAPQSFSLESRHGKVQPQESPVPPDPL